MRISSFEAAEAALQRVAAHGVRRTVDTTEYVAQCMDYLGNPQNRVPAVHIAGTSGKTSTAYYTAALLQAAGYKVGLFVSPHIWHMNERVLIDMQPLSERHFCAELGMFLDMVTQSGVPLTSNEILYMFAFWQFAKQGVEYMVIEVGRGGLLDATNVMSRPDKTCIITDVGLDHVPLLGTTLGQVAAHKAGIIQLHNRVVCYAQDPLIMQAINERAARKLADVHTHTAPPHMPTTPTLPPLQRRNAGLALYAVRAILSGQARPDLSDAQISSALSIYIPGRCVIRQQREGTIIFDGAHNVQKLTALLDSIVRLYPGQPIAAMVAFAQGGGRAPGDMVAALDPVAHCIATSFPASVHGKRPSWPAADIMQERVTRGLSATAEVVPNAHAAYRVLLARPEPIKLITGSFRLVQHVYPLATEAGAKRT